MMLFTENNGGWTAMKADRMGKSMIFFILLLIVLNTIIILRAVLQEIEFKIRLCKLSDKQKKILKERDMAFEKSRKYMDLNSVLFLRVSEGEREMIQQRLDSTITDKTQEKLIQMIKVKDLNEVD